MPDGFVKNVVGCIRHQSPLAYVWSLGTTGAGCETSQGVHPLYIDSLSKLVPPRGPAARQRSRRSWSWRGDIYSSGYPWRVPAGTACALLAPSERWAREVG